MAGSQTTAGLRGGAVRDNGPRTAQMKPRAWPSFLCSARRPNSTARRETWCSPRVQGCGDKAVLKRSGKMDAEPGSARFGLRQANSTVKRKQGVRLGEGAVVGGLNSFGSFAVHARASPSGGLSRRPDDDLVVQRRDGFGLLHGRSTAKTCCSWILHGRPSLAAPNSSFLPLQLGARGGFWGKVPKRRRGTGRLADRMALGIYRAVVARVSGRRMVQMWHGGAWPPSCGASAAGGRRPWGRRGGLPAPRCRHGENGIGRGKRWGKERADRRAPHGGETRRGLVLDGPAVRWAERARRAGG
jgi:hypothetical protein